MAFLDSLWFGEAFDPNGPPDYWLVEMSGIPYGIHNDQLAHPNFYRGMLFAMSARPGPNNFPLIPPIWKAWDTLQMTADGVQLLGFWDNAVPVTTGREDVLASVYMRPDDGAVVALASWANANVTCTLHIDWKMLGLDAGHANISAPYISGFQESRVLLASNPVLTVAPGQGWILDITSAL